MSYSPSTQRRGITIVDVIVVIFVLLLLFALILPTIQRPHQAPYRPKVNCRNNLKQIALALNNYENRFGIFPPAMTVAEMDTIVGGCEFPSQRTGGFSWRALILPDIEEQNLYNAIDFDGTAAVLNCSGTNGPPGATWTKKITVPLHTYLCPSDKTYEDIDNGWFGANYAAMISVRPNYRCSDDKNHPILSRPQDIGVLHPQKPASYKDIANDGSSYTILLAEIDRSGFVVEQGVPLRSLNPRCGRWFNSRGCYVDAVRTPEDYGTPTNPKFDEAMFDRAVVFDHFTGSNTHGWGRAASSAHGGGTHVAMTDGSVQWIEANIDLQLYRATCTRDGGEDETIEF